MKKHNEYCNKELTDKCDCYVEDKMSNMKIIWEIETTGLSKTSKITEIRFIDLNSRIKHKWVKDVLELKAFVKILLRYDILINHYGTKFDIPVLINNLKYILSNKELSEIVGHLMKTSYDISVKEKNIWTRTKQLKNESNIAFQKRVLEQKTSKAKFSMDNLRIKYAMEKEDTLDVIERVYEEQNQ